jgi:DNA-binding CsgD family transcriptional regulator
VTLHQPDQARILHLHDPSRQRPAAESARRPSLDDDAARVYTYVLERGFVDGRRDLAAAVHLDPAALDDMVQRLLELRLLRAEPGASGRLTPQDPEVAAASLIAPLEAEIHHRRDLITGIREQLDTLQPRYAEARSGRGHASYLRMLRDRAEVRGSLHRAADACRADLLCVRPRHASWDGALDEALVRDLAVLGRGVRLRVLYQHAARADLATRAHIRRIVAGGAQVRTTNHLSRPFAVFDRRIALAAEPWGAVEVSNTAVAELLCDVFEDMWSSAQPYSAAESGYEGVSDEIQKTIAKLLAEGLTDEAIARRVGMSLRACRRHVATLLRGLGAVSRFQAGIRAASVGLVRDDWCLTGEADDHGPAA